MQLFGSPENVYEEKISKQKGILLATLGSKEKNKHG